jgi:hypothetical protein
METTKAFEALEKFIKSRSGMDYRDYFNWQDNHKALEEGRRAYRAEARSITKDRREALAALAEARSLPPRYDVLVDSFKSAFSGRLEWDGAKLSYCTGQYYPTEYRKAARAVLQRYIQQSRAIAAAETPRQYVYNSMADVQRANAESGGCWFDKSTMRFFKSRIETGIVKCGYGEDGVATAARFITSEQGPDGKRAYTIREATPTGDIETVGEFQGYATLKAARAAILVSR